MKSSTEEQTSRTRTSERAVVGGPGVRQLTPTEFNTAMVHLYRGEVGRANTWRMRLDGTSNWAVLTTGATLSFAFSSDKNTHVMILINSLLILFFLYIEARRYRFYDLWRSRVRLMETEFFAEMLTPAMLEEVDDWRQILANDLLRPHFSTSMWQALGRRLRRNYIWIFTVLAISWVVKIVIHPTTATSFADLFDRMRIGPIPAWFVLLAGVVFNAFIAILAITTTTRWSSGETHSREEARKHIASGEPAE
jgi:uncharacterized membrane protein